MRRITSASVSIMAMHMAGAAEPVVLTEVKVEGQSFLADSLKTPSTTGSRLNLNILEVPASVEPLSEETMLQRGDYNVKDAVTRTTGLVDYSTPGDGGISFSSRGLSGNNSVGLTEDGQRVMVGAGTVTGPSNTWGYERVEVLRGIGSVINGTGTVGGTINLIRKTPQREKSTEALLGVGNFGTYRAAIGTTGALGQAGAYRIDAYTEDSDGFVDRGNASSKKIMSSVTLDLNERLKLDLQADYSEQRPSRYWGTPLVNGVIDKSLRTQNYNVSDAKIQYNDTRVLGRLSWSVSPALKIKEELFYYEGRRHWKDAELYKFNTATGLVDRDSSGYIDIIHDQKQTVNRIEANHEAGPNQLTFGWEAGRIDFTHSNNFALGDSTYSSSVPPIGFDPGLFTSTIPTVPAYDTTTRTQAFYIEDGYNIGSRWTLVAGLRHDSYDYSRSNSTTATAFGSDLSSNSGRAGVTYKLDPSTRLYAQASRGSDPIGSLLSLNLANSKFSLTTAKQTEVGIKQDLDSNRGWWSAALYRITKDNIITRSATDPTVSFQGGSQSSEGIELSSSIRVAKRWRVDANATILNAKFDKLYAADGSSLAGKLPSNVPETVANLWLSYDIGQWNAGAGARYVSKRYADDANTQVLDAYTVFDASASYRVSKNLNVRAVVRNLTDRVYATAAYSSDQVFLGAPRHAEVIAEFSF